MGNLLTGASSSIDLSIPHPPSSAPYSVVVTNFYPFLAFHQFPGDALWQNQIKLVQIIARDKFVIKSLSDAFSDVLMWRGRQGGGRTSDTGQRTQKYRCSGHVQSNIIVPNYSPTLPPPSPPPHPPGAQCGQGWVFNQYPNIIPATGPIILPGYTSLTVSDRTISAEYTVQYIDNRVQLLYLGGGGASVAGGCWWWLIRIVCFNPASYQVVMLKQ